LRAQYAKLEKTNNETNQNAKKVSEELKQVKEDFNLLLDINTTYKMENDELKRRIRSNLSDDECSDSNIKKIAKKKSKEKHDIYESDYDQHEEVNSTIDPVRESNENEARVC
jgi:regulator of replication initiation timing